MCVRSASASGSEGAFAFVSDCGCGGFGSLCPAEAGRLSPLFFSFCSFTSFSARELFDLFGFAFVVFVASGAGVALLLRLFVGEPPSRFSVASFLSPIASSLPVPFPFPSSSRFSSTGSTTFSTSNSPTFSGAGDESCKNIPTLLDTCFFFPYTLAGFFGNRWVSIVSVVVVCLSVAFLRCVGTLVVGFAWWDGLRMSGVAGVTGLLGMNGVRTPTVKVNYNYTT